MKLQVAEVLVHADTRLVLTVGKPLPGTGIDCVTHRASKVDQAAGRAYVIGDGGNQGTGLLIPHRRRPGQAELPAWKEESNAEHRQVRARVEHVLARIKNWKILRDCRRRGKGVQHAAHNLARMHNLALAG